MQSRPLGKGGGVWGGCSQGLGPGMNWGVPGGMLSLLSITSTAESPQTQAASGLAFTIKVRIFS